MALTARSVTLALALLAATSPARGQVRADAVPGELIVAWRQPAATPGVGRTATVRRRLGSGTVLYRLADRSAGNTRAALRELRADPRVAYAEPNFVRHAMRVPNDPLYPVQWHLKEIGLEQAWNRTVGSPQVVVAVVDSGVMWAHPDLKDRLVQGYDFISNPDSAGDGDGRDADARDEGAEQGGDLHGTHVAGIIGASANNGQGIAGVDWACRLLPVRAIGVTGSGNDADISEAIRWAAGLQVPGVPINPHPAQVINLSLGGKDYGKTLARAIEDARVNGAIVVAAAGNIGPGSDIAPGQPSYPAANPNVISVGATEPGGWRAAYSNFGPTLDLMAPGGATDKMLSTTLMNRPWSAGILSTLYPGGDLDARYGMLEGTSQAAPVVAGVIALMLAVNPQLDYREVLNLLQSTADTSAQCPEGCGAGLVNAADALAAAAGDLELRPFSGGGELTQDDRSDGFTGSGCSLGHGAQRGSGPGIGGGAVLLLGLLGLLFRSRRR